MIAALTAAANAAEQPAREGALQQVKCDPSYREPKWREESKHVSPDIGFMEVFSDTNGGKSMGIYGCKDKSSTVENPVMYMETVINGEVTAYRVEINKIDLADATLVEAFALSAFTASGGEASHTTSLFGAWTNLLGSKPNEYVDSYLDKINVIDTMKSYFIENAGHSAVDVFRFSSRLDNCSKNGGTEAVLVQYLSALEIIDEAAIAVDARNRHTADKRIEYKSIEGTLWARGIDYTYPDGTKYSDYLSGAAGGGS